MKFSVNTALECIFKPSNRLMSTEEFFENAFKLGLSYYYLIEVKYGEF